MHEYEREILRRRREHLILRVDRADLSKNILRGFAAFDLFLEQHPEFAEQVTFIAHLIPSRQDVPEYAEYLERIEALVAVVNHRHGTTDWMPIDLRLRENLEEAIAAYKHYDLLMVNAMFDGMNLIAKEGPLVNERHGVSLLSENTGAHEELAEFALSVNPFDVQEQADAIHRALIDVRRRALVAGGGAEAGGRGARPGRLGRRPAGRHRGEVGGPRARRAEPRAGRSGIGRELAGAGAGPGGAGGSVGAASAARGPEPGRRPGVPAVGGDRALRRAGPLAAVRAPRRRSAVARAPAPARGRGTGAGRLRGSAGSRARRGASAAHAPRAPGAARAPAGSSARTPAGRRRSAAPAAARAASRPTLAHRTRRRACLCLRAGSRARKGRWGWDSPPCC